MIEIQDITNMPAISGMFLISIIRKFKKLLNKQQQKKLFFLGLVTCVGAFLEVIGVSLMMPITVAILNPDIINTNHIIVSVCSSLDIHSHKDFVLLCIILLIIVFIVKNLYLLLQYYIQARFVYDNRLLTQKQMLHTFLNRPYEFYLSAKSGEIMRNVNDDVVETYRLLMTLLTFFAETTVATALIITVFVIAPAMTSLIFAMMAIIVYVIIKFIKPKLKIKGDELRIHTSLQYKWLLQSVQGIKSIKTAQQESFFEKKFYESSLTRTSSAKWQMVFNHAPKLIIEASCVCATLSVIAILIYSGQKMEELVPALATFAMAAVKLMPTANHIVNASNDIVFNGPAIDKLLENIPVHKDAEIEHYLGHNCLVIKNNIEVRDITYSYPNADTKILDNASFVIPVGACVGLIGKSGAGKTTTVDILLGLLKPQTGEIICDGVNVMENYTGWLANIGYIPQSIFILDGTIAENVAFGNEIIDEKIWKALEESQLADYVRSLPDKAKTCIGERGIRLSGGQLQRIGIARALYNDPETIIFDEATSSLDNDTETAIMESVNHLHGKKTMIIIAHRLHTIEECDFVYEVSNGKIIKSDKYGKK